MRRTDFAHHPGALLASAGLGVIAALVAAAGWQPAEAMKIRPLADRVIVAVVENADPDELGRIRVVFPAMPERSNSPFPFRTAPASILLPFGARTSSAIALPEVGDEVLVAFAEGDLDRPVVLGEVWDGEDPPAPVR